MRSLNYYLGNSLNAGIKGLVNLNFKILRFIPNGRFFVLDIKRSGENVDTIFDVGANVGQTCLELVKYFPDAKIYSFEPVPQTYEELKTNTKSHSTITCVNLALGTGAQNLDIVLHDDSELNSLKADKGNANNKVVQIAVDSGKNYCKEQNINKIDLLKIDVEGYELEVLAGFDSDFLKNNVKFIYAEASYDRSDKLKTTYADLDKYLFEMGFITTGFYEPFRWGKNKLRLGFGNVLFTNIKVLNT